MGIFAGSGRLSDPDQHHFCSGCSTGRCPASFSLVEIKASRPYKTLKKNRHALNLEERQLMQRYELILKSISLGVILLGAGLVLWRAAH